MRKLKSDAKPIDIELAAKMYHEGKISLRSVAQYFGIHHANLMFRFKRFGIPTRSISEAMSGNPKCSKTGHLHPQWKGGYSTDLSGYIINNKTKVRQHREIAEEVLGRPLRHNEVVHHLDGNRSNNAHSNLIICSASYHHWLHAKMQGFRIGINRNNPAK
jgi:hypothetical protein